MYTRYTYREKITCCLIGVILLMVGSACTEPFQGEVAGLEDILVVNALITNENKHQEVRLSRPYRFDENAPIAEENAMVSIDNGTEQFAFEEVEPGIYVSDVPFAAETGKPYRLLITTENGRSYQSDAMQLPVANTSIDNLYAERTTNDEGDEGMGIFVDTFDASSESNYYRYEYQETFKIIAPFWSPMDVVFVIQESDGPVFDVILREREEKVCYGTEREKSINVVNTLNLGEDRLSRYNVRFIDRSDYILSHRYSILVRQYVQTPEAFAYYEALRGLSQSSTSVFSEDQPGFLAGNIFSLDDENENVAGFFEVAAVTEKRIFFNYEDFFPGEELPPYFQECMPATQSGEDLKTTVLRETRVFYDFNQGIRTVPRACGDCNALGSNKVPDFWEE
ncbi:DUF4249 domain-containing protein [Maribacter sp.]